ncbi:MAG: tRNA (adenosine(37)-N6)-threonylcarbamoyltransferase complex transferase subunit TsaD [Candidatus Omnitrophica bacterium]|nr:tRNA (adenosine(37)-N6)-threonylcarbamoyltransferase complex transferase subunit TsaD [Candidatus Omnitrophota bacterium]
MIVLGIETSCDETAVAVVKNGRTILSSVVYSSLAEHKPFGGVVPEIASRSHVESLLECLEVSLKKAKLGLKDVDLVAVTRGPGLMGSLLVGVAAAKTIAWAIQKPLVGVDHVLAHIYAGFLSQRLKFPVLGLVVSGGHTLLIRMDAPHRVRILGRTIDDAAGEAFDKVAKVLGLGYPGGPEIDRLARGENTKRFHFTRPFLSSNSLNFSFSGIKTAVLYRVKDLKSPLTLKIKKEICAGFEQAVCEALVKKTARAVKEENLRTVVIGGGVSANSRLRALFKKTASEEGFRAIFPENSLCQDNAVMIAALGAALYSKGKRDPLSFSAYPDFFKRETLS